MNSNGGRALDRRSAERALRGDHAAAGPALRDLLTAATAPPRDGELTGEHAALAEFRAARRVSLSRGPKRLMITRLVTPKLAAVAVATATLATGGVVAVAATGGLSGSDGSSPAVAPATTSAPATSRTEASTRTSPTGVPSTDRTGEQSGDRAGAPVSTGRGTPQPSLHGLCRAYTAGAKSSHGKALENPAFSYLVATAGGRDKVDAYCASLPAGQPGDATPPRHAGGSASTTSAVVPGKEDPPEPQRPPPEALRSKTHADH
jgi:hypothetical protein